MGIKQKMRLTLNLAMTVLLPPIMTYSLMGETLHEWLGIAMASLFAFHQLLNIGWYKNLFHGRYTMFRLVLTIINLLLLADFLLLFYSGIDLFRQLLPLLPELGSASLSRVLHMSGSHWGLILMSLHLGLHINRFILPLKKYRILSVMLTGLTYMTAFYGCYSFTAMNFADYLFPKSAFLFFDAGQPIAKLLVQLITVMVLFALLGAIAARLTQNKTKKEKN